MHLGLQGARLALVFNFFDCFFVSGVFRETADSSTVTMESTNLTLGFLASFRNAVLQQTLSLGWDGSRAVATGENT